MTYRLCYNPGPNPVRLDDEGRTVEGLTWAPYNPDVELSKRMLDMGFIEDVNAAAIDDRSNPDAYAALLEVQRLNVEQATQAEQPKEETKEDQQEDPAATVSGNKISKRAKG